MTAVPRRMTREEHMQGVRGFTSAQGAVQGMRSGAQAEVANPCGTARAG
jgi:hypothetical protein